MASLENKSWFGGNEVGTRQTRLIFQYHSYNRAINGEQVTVSSPDDFLFNSRTFFSCFRVKSEVVNVGAPTLHSLDRETQESEKWEIITIKKVTWLGAKRISKTEESLSSLTGPPLHINERLGLSYILVPVRIHMPNYNIFIKWECNFHKGDYKLSTRSGKALFVLCISLGRRWWCGSENDLSPLVLLGDYIGFFFPFFLSFSLSVKRRRKDEVC